MYKQLIYGMVVISIITKASAEHPQIPNLESLKQEGPRITASTHAFQRYTVGQFAAELRKIVLEAAPLKAKRVIEELKDEKLAENKKPRKILLYGPSGSGKTTLAQVIAEEIGQPYLFISAGLLGTEYKNSVVQNLEREITPYLGTSCVIVIDEADCILQKPKSAHDPEAGTSNQVWQVIDLIAKHPHITLILTTNDPSGMLKPLQTRFAGRTIEVPSIDSHEARKKIIKFFLKDEVHNCNDTYLSEFTKKASELSIRELEVLIRNANMEAYHRKSSPYLITSSDFDAAFKDMKESRKTLEKSTNNKKDGFSLKDVNTVVNIARFAYLIWRDNK